MTVAATRNCGRNSLYILLHLCGHDVRYKGVAAAVPVADRGTSLLELRDAAAQLGLPSTLHRWTMTELRAMREPVIVHLRRHSIVADGQSVGHYVVVLSVSAEDMVVLDSSFGRREVWDPDRFEKSYWTGGVLVPDRSTSAGSIMWVCLSAGWLAGGIFGIASSRRPKVP